LSGGWAFGHCYIGSLGFGEMFEGAETDVVVE
jgi:hypothetical protein